jgi:hypothetical protein
MVTSAALSPSSTARWLTTRRIGGAGGQGGNGGHGQGGGLYNDANAQAALTGSIVAQNVAAGGTASDGGAAGQGVGGGLYIATGGKVSADAETLIAMNHASTSDAEVFGKIS